jgi:hypothetical protein
MVSDQDVSRCFIVGTGPSLGEMEGLEKLDCVDTFGVNRLALWPDLSFVPTYYAGNLTEIISGYTPMAPECQRVRFAFYNPQDDISNCPSGWTPVAKRMRFDQSDDEIVGLGDTLPRIPGGGTITLTVAQWALWMGYKQLYLLGVDQAETKPALQGTKGSLAGNFIRWQVWEWLREYCEDHDVVIRDCTPDGQLTARKILEYQPLDEALHG